jgi:tetratricopeptide (TPR) repeat protein
MNLSRPAESRNAAEQQPIAASRLPHAIWQVLGGVVLAAALWLVYRSALDDPFIFDDSATIVANESIRQLWPLWTAEPGLSALHPPTESPVRSRPLVNLSLAVNYHFGELDPAGYRAVNLAIHLLTALLLWAVVARTLKLNYFAGRFQQAAEPLGFAVASIWALHPLNTESVVYVTQRTELLMGFFYLATSYASLRYWAAGRKSVRTVWLLAAAMACVAGMLSKEMMASAPVMVWLYERTFVTGSFRGALRRSWPLYVGLSLAWIPVLLLNLGGPSTPATGFGLGVPASVWWLTQTKVLFLYLKLAVWPWPLVIHYEIPYLRTLRDAWPWVLAAGLLVAATIVLLWRRSSIGYVLAWVLIVLSPTLMIPLVAQTAAERRMYVPLTALAALAVVGGYSLMRRLVAGIQKDDSRKWGVAIPVSLLVISLAAVFARVSSQRLLAYDSELALWQDAALYQPHDPLVRANLGITLAHLGRQDEALAELSEAVELDPNSLQIQYNLARALEASGQPNEAAEHYREALRLRPEHAASHNNLGRLLAASGDAEAALKHYEMAIELDPNLPEAHNNLGTLLLGFGHTRAAIEQFEMALRLKVDSTAYNNLAAAYDQDGRLADALEMARKAIPLARAEGNHALADRLQAAIESQGTTAP